MQCVMMLLYMCESHGIGSIDWPVTSADLAVDLGEANSRCGEEPHQGKQGSGEMKFFEAGHNCFTRGCEIICDSHDGSGLALMVPAVISCMSISKMLSHEGWIASDGCASRSSRSHPTSWWQHFIASSQIQCLDGNIVTWSTAESSRGNHHVLSSQSSMHYLRNWMCSMLQPSTPIFGTQSVPSSIPIKSLGHAFIACRRRRSGGSDHSTDGPAWQP